jgi:hypothetical protein
VDFDWEDEGAVAIVLAVVLVDNAKTDIMLEPPQHCDILPQQGIQGLLQAVETPGGLISCAQKPNPISAGQRILKCV